MKRLLLFCGLLLLHIPASAWENSMAPAGKAFDVLLVKDGMPAYRIMRDSDEIPESAVKLLKDGLHAITGKQFEENGKGNLPAVHLAVPDVSLGMDGYRIALQNGDILLQGGSVTGIRNAVLAFLEEDLGWRHYRKGKAPCVPGGILEQVKVTPREYCPPFYQRSVWSFYAFDDTWAQNNRIRNGNFGKWFVHTIFELVPPREYYEKHPEYFALVDGKRVDSWEKGQLCFSNSELVNVVSDRILEILSKNPGLEFFALSQNDAPGFCECSQCQADVKAEGSVSAPMLKFVNRVAKRIARSYPHVIIVTEAYRDSITPPGKTRPEKNVVVRLCLDSRISRNPFWMVSETEDLKLLKDWSSITDRLLVWDYIIDFRNYLMPRADLPVLEANIRLYRDKKVKGVMMQTNYANQIGSMAAMRTWILAKLLWNPDWSIYKLAEDYLIGYWGEATGKILAEYNELLIREWKRYRQNSTVGETFRFSPDFYEKAMKLIVDAKKSAGNNTERLKELELEELTLYYFLLSKGVKKDGDVADYKKTLDSFEKMLDAHGITLLIEGGYGKAKEKIRQWRDGILLLNYLETRPSDNITLPATWNVYYEKLETPDPDSLVGRCMAQPPDGDWSVQWRFTDFPQLRPGKYLLRIRARADKKNATGEAAVIGIYNEKSNTYAFSCSLPAAHLDEKYKWIDCGSLILNGDPMFLYTTVGKNSAIKKFYVDAVEFVPLKKEGPGEKNEGGIND